MISLLNSLPENSVCSQIESPVGTLSLIASDDGLRALLWGSDLHEDVVRKACDRLPKGDRHPVIQQAKAELQEYFAGERTEFTVPIVMEGTSFQKKAWNQLRKIPYGKTISYSEQAKRLGDGKAVRAVGTANSRNPISIIVPCHRVIAKNGDLAGFGGGLKTKEYLLRLEQRAG